MIEGGGEGRRREIAGGGVEGEGNDVGYTA